MDHIPRFHRRRKDVGAPTLITSDLPAKKAATTTSPGDLQPGSPMRQFQKLSPFRVFHRSSGKRARDSPPASLPHSPAEAHDVLARESADGRPVSPLSLKTDNEGDQGQKAATPPKMPAFLNLSDDEILKRFYELVWRERNRLLQSINNPSPDFRWARVTGPHLKTLDRYMNVQPWQNNRIKLQVPEGHVDYINASPIVLTPSNGAEPDRYIAMQGPKQVSTDHVWRMVFEQLQDPAVIVMLTETHEGNMEKCFPYFPRSKDDPPLEINRHDEFGDGFRATVRCEGMEETPAGDAIELRKLVIRVLSRPQAQIKVTKVPETTVEDSENKEADSDVRMESPNSARPTPSKPDTTDGDGGGEDKMNQDNNDITTEPEERTVYHFLYKKWPDFGVPSLSDLDSFFTLMRLSREKNAGPGNPRIVHCSAGVGRSGTFIALEHLMRELESGALANYDDVNPAASVSVPGTDTPSLGPGGGGGSDAGGAEEAGSGPPPGGMRDMIFETVNQLREQRRTMVQAESQYLFIYRVLRQLWVAKYGGGGGEGRAEGAAVDHDNDAATAAGAGDEPAAKRLEVDPALVGKDRDRDHHDSSAE